LAEAIPATVPKGKEHRSEQRYRVKWHVVVTIDGLGTYRGFIKDISTKGTAVFLERNLQGVRTATLHVHVPTLETGGDPRVIEVQGKVVYSNHDSDELHFRSGIFFTRFKAESDSAYLSTRLQSCHVEID
jgi:hypothetical protein